MCTLAADAVRYGLYFYSLIDGSSTVELAVTVYDAGYYIDTSAALITTATENLCNRHMIFCVVYFITIS